MCLVEQHAKHCSELFTVMCTFLALCVFCTVAKVVQCPARLHFKACCFTHCVRALSPSEIENTAPYCNSMYKCWTNMSVIFFDTHRSKFVWRSFSGFVSYLVVVMFRGRTCLTYTSDIALGKIQLLYHKHTGMSELIQCFCCPVSYWAFGCPLSDSAQSHGGKCGRHFALHY